MTEQVGWHTKAALDEALALNWDFIEQMNYIAESCNLDLSVDQDGDECIMRLTERRTGFDLIVTKKMKRLHRYITAYSQGRDAGISESIDSVRPDVDDWKKSEAAKEIAELGEKYLDLLKMGDGT